MFTELEFVDTISTGDQCKANEKNESRGLIKLNSTRIAEITFYILGISTLVGFLLCGCEAPSPRAIVEKTISEKLASTEQRLGFDVFDNNNGFRSRASTVYYLIAEDGTMIEVTLREYARVKIGQAIHSADWK
jgi:hypothetical protein